MTDRAAALRITALRKSFAGRTVLDGLDLTVDAGSVFALLGPNGAGKTTLINIATTLLAPDAGEVVVAGHDVGADPDGVRSVISVTGQHTGVDEILTARENLVLIGRLRGQSRATARRGAEAMLEQFDLVTAADRRVATFSGGMRRRLDLALSLVTAPEIIFLDEPTTGLDTRSRQHLWSIISGLAARGVTVLLTTQYLEEADHLADRVAVLNDGRIVAVGDPRELKARVGQEVLEIRDADHDLLVEVPTDGSLTSIRRSLGEASARLDPDALERSSVTLRKPTLDDVFLTLTGGGAR